MQTTSYGTRLIPSSNPVILPLIDEPRVPLTLQLYSRGAAGRQPVEDLIRNVFRHTHGAEVREFHPDLLGFQNVDGLQAVVGLRGGSADTFFAEQYLDVPVEMHITRETGVSVTRNTIIEVGNLAMAVPGQSRWLIAAVTAYLYNGGYRWVLFTAVTPLYNAFRRLGLTPILLAEADPARLPGRGREWGTYFDLKPRVYAGHIASGYRIIRNTMHSSSLHMQDLWQSASLCGALHHQKQTDRRLA